MMTQTQRYDALTDNGSMPQTAAKPKSRLRVVAVQCIACSVVLAVALLLRLTGGTAYQQLRQAFWNCMMKNDLPAALASLWDGEAAQSTPAAATVEAESDIGVSVTGEGEPFAAGKESGNCYA